VLSAWRRLLLALALAVCATAAYAPAARAGEYSVNACRHADGSAAPTDGWQVSVVDDYAANDVATNSCAQGGQVDLAFGAGTPHGRASNPATASATVTFAATPPPGTSWSRVDVWWAYRAYPVTAAHDPAHLVAGVIAGSALGCSWGRGTGACAGRGLFAGPPLSDANLTTVSATAAGQPAAVGVVCDSSPALCPAASGEPYAQLRAWRMLLTLVDATAPVLAEQPALPPSVGGSVAVPISAADTGSGVHTARLLVDGAPTGAPVVLDVAGGRCVQQADGSFDYLAPCPAQVSGATVALDVRSVRDGRHSVVVRVTDAAGNATDSAPAVLTIDNPVAVSSVPLQNPLRGRGHVHNGSGSASTGKLKAGLRTRRGGKLRAKARVLPGRRVRVSGRLVGSDRKPVGGAVLVLRRRTPGHAPRYLTFRTRSNGTFDRVVRWGKSKRLMVQWYPWGDSTSPVSSRSLRFLGAARITLRVSRAPRNGRPLRVAGKVHGAPAGGRVTIQVRTGPFWRTFLTPRVNRRGRFSGRRLLLRSGGVSYCLRARILSQPGFDYSAGFTKPVCRRVRG
jgi:hypothetical protein